MKFGLESSAFNNDSRIPERYTCDGDNISPALRWSNQPAGTMSFAIVMDDPDAPHGTWVHWVIWNIGANARQLEEAAPVAAALPDGSRQGVNSARNVGYNGPCPPGASIHRYSFRLYALDSLLDLPSVANKEQLLAAMEGHILGQAELMGRYSRAQ